MQQSSSRGRLLIVDDDYSVCAVLTERLSQEGYECQSCPRAELALELMERQAYDAVILDLMMPGVSGLEVLMAAKKNYPQTAFLIATGMNDPQLAARASKQGADAYLVKPFQLNELVSNVARALERKRLDRKGHDEPPKE